MARDRTLRWWRAHSGYEWALLLIFLATLPFLHPLVNGDGVGYYAWIRSPLIDHDFQFKSDWQDPGEELEKIYLVDHFVLNPVTKTGHLPNFYAVGPAILWSPFLVVTHAAVLTGRHFGWQVAADGHSWPYVTTMAFATALYGFAAMWLAFAVTRRYVDERWAFWATVGIWLATSLPAYIFLLPAWSHAHSAFVAALFLFYWLRTRGSRTPPQWLILGLISGLLIDVNQLNGIFCLAVAYEAVTTYVEALRAGAERGGHLLTALRGHLVYAAGTFAALLPTFITRQIVFGGPLEVGPYTLRLWNWSSPAFGVVLFSTTHGLLVFAPILVLSIAGLFFLRRLDSTLGNVCALVTVVYYFLICCFPWPLGAVGFGNRFFVSLTPIFVLGLAALFSRAAQLWRDPRTASLRLIPVTILFIIWNLGLAYQWQTHLLPRYGPVYWDELLYNQFRVVPGQALRDLAEKLHLR